ncbi:MAG TPA: hypothetical protein DD435_07090 [Cyanobacteria bacterium UBA8530]|nr:hypothetical protein [Cyanobacteria bacterium UBA8530]
MKLSAGRIVLALFTLYAAVILGRLLFQETILLYKAHVLQTERVIVLQKKTELLREINRSGTPDGIERLAREKLGLVRPGEVPVKSPEGSASTSSDE